MLQRRAEPDLLEILLTRMKPVQEVWGENTVHKIEGILLEIDAGEKELHDVLRR